MTIARQLELTLIGDVDARLAIMSGLQALGAVHLVPLVQGGEDTGPDAADDAREALNYLVKVDRKRRPQRVAGDPDIDAIVQDILHNKYLRSDAIDRSELIRQRQRLLRPWGDFQLPPSESLDGMRFWFYQLPLGKEAALDDIQLPYQQVSIDQRFRYLVVVAADEPTEQQVPIPRVHVGALSLSQLEEQLEETLVELEDLNAEREHLTRWIVTLTDALNQVLDDRDLHHAERQALVDEACFVVRGWIPETRVAELEAWSAEAGAAYTLREPGVNDQPPTLLENSDQVGGGQVAVSFFQLPGYRNWDPSGLLFVSFSLFFAMILSDAGYGALLGLVLLVYWRRLSEPGTTQVRLRNLWLSLVVSTIGYGIMVGSYFGVSPAETSWLASLKILELNDFDTMMRLSIAVGTLHLMIAHAMVFWINRGTRVGMVALAWLVGVGSGFGLWLHYVLAADFSLGTSPFSYGLLAWLVLLLLFSGSRPYDSATNVALNLGAGLSALTGLTKAFGDVLSYMRLFALGLAGASLAATFNALAVAARDASPQFGFLFFLGIVVLGHTLNITLALMSGVIHGLRLNLMEFYNWGIQDEGYPFKAFAKRGGSKWRNS